MWRAEVWGGCWSGGVLKLEVIIGYFLVILIYLLWYFFYVLIFKFKFS
jgi:hypothetical protein